MHFLIFISLFIFLSYVFHHHMIMWLRILQLLNCRTGAFWNCCPSNSWRTVGTFSSRIRLTIPRRRRSAHLYSSGLSMGTTWSCRAPRFCCFIFLFIKTFNGGGGFKPFGYMFLTPIIGGRWKWIEMEKLISKFGRSKRFVELKVHWDGFKRARFLMWWCVVTFMR
jgi:hypothetical protein